MKPNRLGSLKITTFPFDISKTTWSCVSYGGGGTRGTGAKRSGHPEVHEQHITGCQLGQQILRASRHATNDLPFEASREIRWKGVAQVCAPREDAVDASARHRPLQLAPCVFDLREFGHVAILPLVPGP